jgi:hypothetical protein
MWARAARNRFLTRTIALALACLVCGGAFDWGHAGGDDPDCDVVVVAHDHSAHRFSANPSAGAPAPDHCYICHSLRLLHIALAARRDRAAIALSSAQLVSAFAAAPVIGVGVSLTSRAPPSRLL